MTRNVSVELVIASGPVCQSSVLVQHLIWVRTVISEHELFLVLAFQWWMCVFLHDTFFLLKPPEQCPQHLPRGGHIPLWLFFQE